MPLLAGVPHAFVLTSVEILPGALNPVTHIPDMQVPW